MSDITDLVPPRALCKKIPEGCFANSALVWRYVLDEEWRKEVIGIDVFPRECGECYEMDAGEIIAPAPTLEEILLEIERMGFYCPSACHRHTWIAECECDPVDVEADPFPDAPSAADKRSGATAALLLWLDIQTDNHEKNKH